MPREPIKPHLNYEQAFLGAGYVLIAGIDEAGRGALAGPVSAGAVILPLDNPDLLQLLDGVRDSKLVSPHQRESMFDRIMDAAVAASPGLASHEEIDTMGIAAAARLAMHRAVDGLTPPPQALLVDWVKLHDLNLPQKSIVRGDQKSLSIAAASIIAKVTRDRLMVELDEEYPGYGFGRHKGYFTHGHQTALTSLGPCPIHRRTFDPIRARLIDTE